MKKYFSAALAILLILGIAACRPGIQPAQYTLIAKKSSGFNNQTVTYVRRFEKKNWCSDQMKNIAKNGYATECREGQTEYEAMFRGEAAGKWYLLQRIGRFPPTVVIFEFTPPLPEEMMLSALRSYAPQTVKFAALHRAPAEVLIFSPQGQVKSREKIPAG